jgi:polysaccharide biosynthesis/export protein
MPKSGRKTLLRDKYPRLRYTSALNTPRMNAFSRAFLSPARWIPILLAMLLAGCQTAPQTASAPETGNEIPFEYVVMREGDSVKIAFPSTPKLDSAQLIRRDGKVVLPVFGEIQAAGLTPAELEKQILRDFGTQLVTKEVTVTLESSRFPVFVNGAVLKPGKIESLRPITALEAIMEAGGFDYARANTKSVKVIRTEGTEVKTFILDLRGVLEGKPSKPFYVRASDIVYVPEKFTLF